MFMCDPIMGSLGEEVTGKRFNDISSVEPRERVIIIITGAPASISLFELYTNSTSYNKIRATFFLLLIKCGPKQKVIK